MSEIGSIGGNGTPVHALGQRRSPVEVSINPSGRASDSVEVSATAQLLAKLAALPDVRQELVDRIRGQVAAGTYDPTGVKLDTALDAAMQDASQ